MAGRLDEPTRALAPDHRRALDRSIGAVILLATIASGAIGCVVDAPADSANESFEVDCRGVPCDWVTISGDVRYGPTWHQGDLGVDLSGDGHAATEQRVVLLPYKTRQLELDASVVRDAGVDLHFELDFYAAATGTGETFWDRDPVFLDTRQVEVFELGVNQIHREILIPSEGAAMVVRIVKDGSGRAMVDELTIGHE